MFSRVLFISIGIFTVNALAESNQPTPTELNYQQMEKTRNDRMFATGDGAITESFERETESKARRLLESTEFVGQDFKFVMGNDGHGYLTSDSAICKLKLAARLESKGLFRALEYQRSPADDTLDCIKK